MNVGRNWTQQAISGGRAHERYRGARLSFSSGTPALLHEIAEGEIWMIVVENMGDIRDIDALPEGAGSDDDLSLATAPPIKRSELVNVGGVEVRGVEGRGDLLADVEAANKDDDFARGWQLADAQELFDQPIERVVIHSEAVFGGKAGGG